MHITPLEEQNFDVWQCP